MREPASETVLTRSFVRITSAALCYFIAIGAITPVLPRFIHDQLGGNGIAVGIGVGAFAVSAALLRPIVGKIGDRRGRRVLLVGGTAVAAVSILGYTLANSLWVLVIMRLLTGVGEGAAFVGAATAVQDLAPPDRRGEATSYFSVAVYGGLALGPALGETVRHVWGISATWVVAAGLCACGSVLALGMPRARPTPSEHPATTGRRKWLHPAAVRPGVILALSASGFAGFSAFVPLYVGDVGLSGAGVVFLVYAVVVLAVRIFFARLPDQLGSVRGSSIALALQTAGLLAMAAWATAAGLFITTAIYALGVSMLYPALFPMVVDRAPESERSHAVATFTLFFDVSQGCGAFVLGALVAAFGSERWAFLGAGLLSLLGLVLLRNAARDEVPRLAPATT